MFAASFGAPNFLPTPRRHNLLPLVSLPFTKMRINLGLVATISVSLLAVFYYAMFQRETVEPTKGAVDYYWAYQKIKGETPEKEVRWPYNKRTGMPYIAASLPFDAIKSFQVVNVVSGLLCIVLCYLALEAMAVSGLVRAACLTPLLFFEWSPLRFPFLYPFEANPPAMALYAAAAYCIVRRWYIPAAAALAASCAIRESGVFFGLVLAAAIWLLRAAPPRKCLWVGAVSLVGIVVSHMVTLPLWQPTNPADNGPTAYGTLAYSGTQAEVIWYFIKYRLTAPNFGIVASISAILMCLAPFLLCLSTPWKSLSASLKEPVAAASLGLIAISAVMATFGGKETPRIFFTGYPLYVIFLASVIRHEHASKIVFVSLVGLVTHSFTAVITENPYWGWIPSLINTLAGRTLPLAASYLLFWAAAYVLCRTVPWQNLGQKPGKAS